MFRLALLTLAWEGVWWANRKANRDHLYAEAKAAARRLGKPLVVIGAPDRGATEGPGYDADLVIDIGPSALPQAIIADICKKTPLASNSCVVFVSCVLEYVSDYNAAMREIKRISGGHYYICRVEPWTLTAYLYPGAKRTIPSMG